jgi:cobalamin biosynthesis Mg chelatase CobN
MPEFEGLIDPILVGVAAEDDIAGMEYEVHQGVLDRVEKAARRVSR